MDFFSRLFSFSNSEKAGSKNEEHNIPNRSQADSVSNAKYHESGTFCRESRVDQIESPYSSILTASSDNEQHSNESITSSSNIITRTLDCWNPETCVRLLRMPSVQNYSGLRKLISKSDRNWMIEFLQMGGLEVLFESVDRLSSKKFTNSSRLEHTLLLLQCVSCLKSIIDSHIALEFIIQQKTYAKKIAEVLCSKNPLVKKQLFEFMSKLCVFSEGGHYLTLDVFESYRVTLKLRYRFAVLIIEIKQAEVMPHVGSVLGVINCIILGACGFRFRTRLRNEFLALGLQDLLESLKEISEEEVQLQCSVFIKSQLADEEYASSMGIRSSFSHFALFQAVLDKIEDTPLSASFLILLQNLNQLDPTDSKTDYVWSILEEITERAVTGAGSVLRNWMLSECRQNSMKSASTQTTFFIPRTISVEHVAFGKASVCDEDYEKDSIKSFSSRDSGMPVSRNQSFASNTPRSPPGTLSKQSIEDGQHSSHIKDSSDGEFPKTVKHLSCGDILNTIKGSSDDEGSNTVKETLKNTAIEVHEKRRTSSGIFKTVGLSFTFMNTASNKNQIQTVQKKPHNSLPENTSLSLRSESPIPQNDILLEECSKTKKTFTFPFFTRSKKYSLSKSVPKVKINPPSPDIQRNTKEAVTHASSRDGMTSMDVKRSRKQTQLSNSLLHNNDNLSQIFGEAETLSSGTSNNAFEFYDNYPVVHPSPISRSFPITEECGVISSKDQLGHLSKSTSNLIQDIPPPPPPPPPPPVFISANVEFRPQARTSLGLPPGTGIRSSWSGNPAAKEVDETEKRIYNTLPRPKSKMKTLNWAKIPSTHVSVHSIWSEIERESKAMELNFEEMEKLFCQNQTIQKHPKPRQRQRLTSEISLLDSKRCLSIAVFLKQFKGGLEEVLEYVKLLKHKEIGAEKLRTLLNLLPGGNEVKLLKSYSGDMNRLGTAEKFILHLSAIDYYECRIEGMLLLEEFPTSIQILHDSVHSLYDACQELLTNKGFKNFLKLILVTGNFMNSGSYAGNAMGFRLSTLPKLMDTRANRPRITLLHYLVEETQRRDREGLKFTNELLEKLNRCSRLTLDNLSTEISQLDKTIGRLNLKTEEENFQLKKHFFGFIENGMKHVTILKKKMEDIKNISVQLANRFCEDEKKFQLEECLSLVSVFCAKIKIADSENKARKMAEEKKQCAPGNKIDSQLPYRTSKTSTI